MSKMGRILFMFTFQIILLASNGSDHNKNQRNGEMKMNNENETETVVIIVPRTNHSLGTSGVDTEGDVVDANTLPGELQGGVADGCLCNEGHDSQEAYQMNNVIENLPGENKNLEVCESTTTRETDNLPEETNDDVSEEELVHTAALTTDVITEAQTVDQDPQTNLHESSTNIISLPILNDDDATDTNEASRLDSSIADAPISDLRSATYQQLGAALENINTYDGQDPWWNYLILHHDDLDITRREQRNIERSTRPGLEFLDLLDENGCTLRQLEKMFMRFKIQEALHVLWSQKWPHVMGHSSSTRSPSQERDESDGEIFGNNSVNKKAAIQTNHEQTITAANDNENRFINQQTNSPSNTEQALTDGDYHVTQDRSAVTDASRGETETSTKYKTQSSDANHCTINPCKNGGTCLPNDEGYTCECANKWYTGKDCDTDEGPCNSVCDKRGTSSCYYYGPDYQYTACNCKVGYDGERCETEHDYSKIPPVRTVLDSCNERGLSQNECIADTLDTDKIVNVLGNIFRDDAAEVKKIVKKFAKMFN